MDDIKKTRNGNITVLQKGTCAIVIDESHIMRRKGLIAAALAGDESITEDMDCTPCVYAKEASRLVDIAERIMKQDGFDLFGVLPLTKSGTFPKNRGILLADSKCTQTYNDEYFSRKALQLRLEWLYVTDGAKRLLQEPCDAITLRIDWHDASKKQEPVFDADGNPHTVARARASYLKPESLVPGRVYREKTGTEWLYLGILPVKSETFFCNDGDYPDRIVPSEGRTRDMSLGYAHVRWTSKLASAIGRPKDMTDFLLAYTDLVPIWREKISLRAHPRKFTEEVLEAFDGTAVRQATIRTPNQPMEGSYKYSFVQYYIGR